MTKLSIKLKQTNETLPRKIKISLKKNSNFSLSDVQKPKEKAVVSYVFLDEGQFLFDKRTCSLYTVQAPYKKMGIISSEGKVVLV